MKIKSYVAPFCDHMQLAYAACDAAMGNIVCGDDILFNLQKTKLRGTHNAENLMAATAVGILPYPVSIITLLSLL